MEGKRVPSEESSNSFMLNEEEREKISEVTGLKTESRALTHEDIISGKFAIPMSKNKENIYDDIKGSNKSNASKRISMDVLEKKVLDKSPNDNVNILKSVKENDGEVEEEQSEKEVKGGDKENGKVRKSRISFDHWLVKAAEDKEKEKIKKRESRMKEMEERLARAKLEEQEAKRLKEEEEKMKIMELLRLKEEKELEERLFKEEQKRKKEEEEQKEAKRLEDKTKAELKMREIEAQKEIEERTNRELEKQKQIEKQKEMEKKRQADIQKQKEKEKEEKQKQEIMKQKEEEMKKEKERIQKEERLRKLEIIKKQRDEEEKLKEQEPMDQELSQTQHEQGEDQHENSPSTQEKRVKILPESFEFDHNDENRENDFATLSRMTCSTIRSTMESCVDYLGYVFTYYCKLTYSFNKKTTFSEISTKLEQMTISSFMIFCQDFKIRDEIGRERLMEMFKKYADFQKYLNIEQFHKVVEEISSEMYHSNKEEEMDEEEAKEQKERNYKKTLKFLSLHNSHSFINKMNSLGSNARIKNSKGVTVGNNPKYTFKLTPNNGRSEEQIEREVEERAILRKEIRDKNMQLHKENKTNKIDVLYQNAQLRKRCKMLNTSEHPNDQTKTIIYYDSNALNPKESHQKLVSRSKELRGNSENCKSTSTYYNPCEILNLKGDISYVDIFKLKTKINEMKHRNKSNFSESKYQISNVTYSKDSERLKLNKVISLARQSLLDKSEATSLCASVFNNSIDGENSEIGKIKKQLSPQINRKYLYSPEGSIIKNSARKSIQLREAEIMLNSQIKEIEIPMKKSQLRLEEREFIRASEKADKENNYDLSELEDVLGFKDGDKDEYLEKHYELEKNFEGN